MHSFSSSFIYYLIYYIIFNNNTIIIDYTVSSHYLPSPTQSLNFEISEGVGSVQWLAASPLWFILVSHLSFFLCVVSFICCNNLNVAFKVLVCCTSCQHNTINVAVYMSDSFLCLCLLYQSALANQRFKHPILSSYLPSRHLLLAARRQLTCIAAHRPLWRPGPAPCPPAARPLCPLLQDQPQSFPLSSGQLIGEGAESSRVQHVWVTLNIIHTWWCMLHWLLALVMTIMDVCCFVLCWLQALLNPVWWPRLTMSGHLSATVSARQGHQLISRNF